MFHRLQGSTHQFIRSTYDPISGRSKQAVVYSLRQFATFNSTDVKLAVLTDDERVFLLDWVRTKEAAELAANQKLSAEVAKQHLENLLAALKNYPPDYLAACDIFEACKQIGHFVAPIRKAGMEKIPGIVAPDQVKDMGAELVEHLNGKA